MKVDVFSIENKKIEEFEIDDKIMEIKVKDDAIHNVLLALLNNKHTGSANTKTRGEVAGGGKKPWRQKGTGRARHGSIRSPIWKGGGVTFGPRAHKMRFKVNKTENKMALKAIFIKKIKNNNITILDRFNLSENKTKSVCKILKGFVSGKQKVLLILENLDINLNKILRNINWLKISNATEVNVYDIFIYDKILITKEALKKFFARFN